MFSRFQRYRIYATGAVMLVILLASLVRWLVNALG